MLCIEDNTIKMTKGDTVQLEVIMQDEKGRPYEMKNGDTLTLEVAKEVGGSRLVKSSNNNIITLNENDTKNLQYNEGVYNITLTTDGKKYTVVGITDENTPNIILFDKV